MAVNQKPAASTPPLMKNAAAAPIIYFDGVPAFGSVSGHMEAELSARVLMPKAEGGVAVEFVCVAHLRCSPQAAEALTDALDKALDMHTKQARGLEN